MKVKNFSLKHTIESGQFFRFEEKGGWYYCSERDKNFRILQDGSNIEFEGTSRRHVKKLFGLESNYEQILKILKKDETLRPALEYAKGLRIMRRDPWETLISFQCSVMSNIKKIQLNMKLLSEQFGKGKFPNPGEINNLEKVKKCATGFRAKWIYEANKLDDDYFKKIKRMKYENAVKELMKIQGVGRKVADCICLFSLGKTQAFPVDVWIARVMEQTYGPNKNVVEFAQKRWGKNAGWAQQYLYHWSRNGYAN